MGFRDFAAECRLTAVFALRAVIPAHCDYLIEIASSDPCVKVGCNRRDFVWLLL